MPMLLDENEDQDVLKNGTGLTASQRLPASYAGSSGPAMPLGDTPDYERGGAMAQPRAPLAMGITADLNGNGIPDGAEVVFKQDRGDGSTITAKWQHAMEMFDDRAPKFQPGTLPRPAGMTFDPSGPMAPYNRLSPTAQARIMGHRTIEDQARFVQGQDAAYNGALMSERDRKLAYDLQKSAALTKLGTGLMQLEGHEADAGAQQTAALMRLLGVGETADAKIHASNNYLQGVDLRSQRGLEGTQATAQSRVEAAGVRGDAQRDVAGINNAGRLSVAEANNTAAAAKPILVRGADGSQQIVVPDGQGGFILAQPSTNALPRVAAAQGDNLPTYTPEQARSLPKGTRFRATDGRILTKN